jgi:hypothetical protein
MLKKDRAHEESRVVKIDGEAHEFYKNRKAEVIVHHKNGKDYNLGKESLSEGVKDAKDWHKRNPGT